MSIPSLLHLVKPLDGCNRISSSLEGNVAAVYRGNCSFQEKALNAQEANASMVMIINEPEKPLQRIGGRYPGIAYIGIGSIIITSVCGQQLLKAGENKIMLSLSFHNTSIMVGCLVFE